MKRLKIIPMTAEKPEIFEEKVNELLQKLEADKQVKTFDYNVLYSDGRLIAVFQIEKENRIIKGEEHQHE